MGDIGYPLDLWTPVRHVATEMDRVAPAALSIEEMAATYMHPNTGDISRVMSQEGCANQREANEWLMGKAIEVITRRGKGGAAQVEANGRGYRLAVPFEKLRYENKAIHRARDDHARLRDPFNPNSGEFSDNTRSFSPKDLEELRESMREFGWIEHFPAIEDEHGVVLVGHRRLAVAAELGIDPIIKMVKLGDGDEADAQRFRLALASNLGGKSLTKADRARISKYLYSEAGWSQVRIAEALNVTQQMISKDLNYNEVVTPRAGAGRPRKLTPEQAEQVVDLVFEQGKSIKEAAAAVGADNASNTPSTVRDVVKQEEARREERARECTCPNCGDVHSAHEG